MKRSALARRTPLKRGPWRRDPAPGNEPRRTKALAKMSVRQMRRRAEYETARREYLEEHRHCEACVAIGASVPHRSEQLHHKRGRVGSLIADKRFFCAVCSVCHDWIHSHPAKARELGLLASPAEWNSPPR